MLTGIMHERRNADAMHKHERKGAKKRQRGEGGRRIISVEKMEFGSNSTSKASSLSEDFQTI